MEAEREVILSGDLDMLQAVIELANWQTGLTIYGPIVRGAARRWFVGYPFTPFLGFEGNGFWRFGHAGVYADHTVDVSPGMTLDNFVAKAEKKQLDPRYLLEVGQLAAAKLPGERLRMVLSSGGLKPAETFWRWADELLSKLAAAQTGSQNRERDGIIYRLFHQGDETGKKWTRKELAQEYHVGYERIKQIVRDDRNRGG